MLRALFFIAVLSLFTACNQPSPTSMSRRSLTKQQFAGETMGTTLSIVYLDSMDLDFSQELTQLLLDINQEVSTYIKDATISIFNQQQDSVCLYRKGHFYKNYQLARHIYEQSNGWFNPTVMPLVNYWGFGYTQKRMVRNTTKEHIDSLKALVNFDALRLLSHPSNDSVWLVKSLSAIELDMSACAKGYAVDQVGLLLEALGLEHYFVEIGGEVRARGYTLSGFPWRTGIRQPVEGSATNALQVAVNLENYSLATSGNYENFYVDSATGFKYAHTLNPHTGYPEKNELLSASVFALDCGTADGFATAFMAMGLDSAYQLAHRHPNLEAYFVYSTTDGTLKTRQTAGVAAFLGTPKKRVSSTKK